MRQLYVKLPVCIGLSGSKSEQESHKEAQVSPRNVVLGLRSCLLCHPRFVHKSSVLVAQFCFNVYKSVNRSCNACQAFDGMNRMVVEVVAITGDPASLQGIWH